MENKKPTPDQLQAQWERAVERAAQETPRDHALGEMLQESSGLHVKSGVQAGGLWGTTSCTCQNCSHLCE